MMTKAILIFAFPWHDEGRAFYMIIRTLIVNFWGRNSKNLYFMTLRVCVFFVNFVVFVVHPDFLRMHQG